MLRALERRTGARLAPIGPDLLAVAGVALVGASYWHERFVPHQAFVMTLALGVVLALVLVALLDLDRLVLIVLFCSMVFPVSIANPGGTHVAASDLLLLFAIGAWIAWYATRRHPVAWLRGNPYLPPALAFCAITFASILWSRGRMLTAKQTVQIAEIVVIVPLLYASVARSLERVRHALTAFVVVTAGLSVVVFFYFIQNVARGDLSPEYLPGMHKNATGSFIGVGAVIAYGLWLERRPGSRWAIWLLPIELAGLFGTISRGAMVGTAVGALVVSLLFTRRRLMTVGLIAATTTLFVVTIQWKLPTTGTGGGYSSAATRPMSWAGGVHWIEAHPLFGTGSGTYFDYLPAVHGGLTDPNNLLLLTWAELGIFGFLSLLFLVYRVARVAVVIHGLRPPAPALGAIVVSAIVCSFVHFQFDTTWVRGTATVTFALVGLLLAVLRLAPHAPGDLVEPEDGTRTLDWHTTRADALRVLQVVASTDVTPVEHHVVRLSQALRARGVDCRIACPFAATGLRRAAAFADVPVVPAAGRGAWMVQVLRLLEANPPDVVHAHDQPGSVAAFQAVETTGARFVRTHHATPAVREHFGWRARAAAVLHRSVDRRIDVSVAVSQAVADSVGVVRPGGQRIVVIPAGLDFPSDARVARFRRRVATDDRQPAAVFVGDPDQPGAADLALLALARVRVHVPEFRLVVPGGGPAEGAWRRRADELGVLDGVEWIGAVRDPSDAFERGQFAVRTTEPEAFDPFVLEAMAWGLPAVAPRTALGEELVLEGETGLLFRTGDVRDLADTLVVLALDRARAQRLGAAARSDVLARFRADQSVLRTAALYESLVG